MHELPDLLWVALDYFWTHCPDPKGQTEPDSDEEWERLLAEYDKWQRES